MNFTKARCDSSPPRPPIPRLPAVPRTAAPRTFAPRNAIRQTIATDIRRVSEPPPRRVSNAIRQTIVTPLPAAPPTRPASRPASRTTPASRRTPAPPRLPTPPPKSKRKKGQLHTTIQLALPESCLGRESNPHDPFGSRDFKSLVSTISPPRQSHCAAASVSARWNADWSQIYKFIADVCKIILND